MFYYPDTRLSLNAFIIIHMFQLLEDVLQLKRLKCVIDGHVDDDDTHYEGLLGRMTLTTRDY